MKTNGEGTIETGKGKFKLHIIEDSYTKFRYRIASSNDERCLTYGQFEEFIRLYNISITRFMNLSKGQQLVIAAAFKHRGEEN